MKRCELCGLPWNRCSGHGRATKESQASQHSDDGWMNDTRFGPPEDGLEMEHEKET